MRGALQVYQLKFELEYPEHAMTHFSRRQSDDGGRRRWLSYNDRDGLSNAMVEDVAMVRELECVPPSTIIG